MAAIMKRRLGRSNLEVSATGLGCWAIGGPWSDVLRGGKPAGWGQIDDQESIRAIHIALEQGVTLFTTSILSKVWVFTMYWKNSFAGIKYVGIGGVPATWSVHVFLQQDGTAQQANITLLF